MLYNWLYWMSDLYTLAIAKITIIPNINVSANDAAALDNGIEKLKQIECMYY